VQRRIFGQHNWLVLKRSASKLEEKTFRQIYLGTWLANRILEMIDSLLSIFTMRLFLSPARDLGGVTREYFWMCLSGMHNLKFRGKYSMLLGTEGHKSPNADSALLRTGVFKALGKMMAHSFLHTGIAAYGIAKPIVEYLLTKDIDSEYPFVIEACDIPDMEVRHALEIVSSKTLIL